MHIPRIVDYYVVLRVCTMDLHVLYSLPLLPSIYHIDIHRVVIYRWEQWNAIHAGPWFALNAPHVCLKFLV